MSDEGRLACWQFAWDTRGEVCWWSIVWRHSLGYRYAVPQHWPKSLDILPLGGDTVGRLRDHQWISQKNGSL